MYRASHIPPNYVVKHVTTQRKPPGSCTRSLRIIPGSSKPGTMPPLHTAVRERRVVYLSPAEKYPGLTRRLWQEQKGLDKRTFMGSQRPSHRWECPRCRLCGRTAPAPATFPCCFPLLLLAH